MYVDHLDLYALFPAQDIFISQLYPAATDVIAAAVIGIALDNAVVHLADITQQVSRDLGRIRTDGPVDSEKSGKIAFVEPHLDLFGQLLEQHRSATARKTGSLVQFLAYLFDRHTEDTAHRRRIERAHLPRSSHQVVRLLALYQEPAVTVVYLAARRELHHIPQRIIIRTGFVTVVDHLQIEEPHQQYQHDTDHGQLQYFHPRQTIHFS